MSSLLQPTNCFIALSRDRRILTIFSWCALFSRQHPKQPMQLSIHLGFRVHRSANLCAQQLPVARPQSGHVAAQSGRRETETNSQVIVSRQRIGAASKEDS